MSAYLSDLLFSLLPQAKSMGVYFQLIDSVKKRNFSGGAGFLLPPCRGKGLVWR